MAGIFESRSFKAGQVQNKQEADKKRIAAMVEDSSMSVEKQSLETKRLLFGVVYRGVPYSVEFLVNVPLDGNIGDNFAKILTASGWTFRETPLFTT